MRVSDMDAAYWRIPMTPRYSLLSMLSVKIYDEDHIVIPLVAQFGNHAVNYYYNVAAKEYDRASNERAKRTFNCLHDTTVSYIDDQFTAGPETYITQDRVHSQHYAGAVKPGLFGTNAHNSSKEQFNVQRATFAGFKYVLDIEDGVVSLSSKRLLKTFVCLWTTLPTQPRSG